MVEYSPLEDLPPPRYAFPPPTLVEDPEPPEVGTFPWGLDPSLSMRDRWESLKFPRQDGKDGEVGKIDWVTVDLAINGLKIKWLPASKNLTLIPHVEQWVQRGIVTGDLSVIPKTVHFSRLFYVTKKTGGIRPLLDLSLLNNFILTLQLKMEAISSILPRLIRGMWVTSLDVTDAFLSVSLSLPIQKYFCFVLHGKVFMFLKLPFGLTTAPWDFSRLMTSIKKSQDSRKFMSRPSWTTF